MHEQKHATQNMKFPNNEYFHTILQCIPKGHTCMTNLIKSKQVKTAGVYAPECLESVEKGPPNMDGSIVCPAVLIKHLVKSLSRQGAKLQRKTLYRVFLRSTGVCCILHLKNATSKVHKSKGIPTAMTLGNIAVKCWVTERG